MKLGTTLMSLWMNFRQVMGATGPPPSTLLNDLVSYWPLNEVSGTRYDAVGSNDLTDNNTVGSVLRGPEGTVASFVAANSEWLRGAPVFADDAAATVSLWFKRISTGVCVLFSQNNTAPWYLRSNNGTLELYTRDFNDTVSAGVVGLNEWHMVTVWHDPVANQIGMQIDNATPVTAATGGPNTGSASTVFDVGTWASQYHEGAIASVVAYSRVLTSDERAALFASGNGLRYAELPAGLLTGLVSWWELDEVSGVRYDSHGSNDLTDNNTVGSVHSGPKGVVGSFVDTQVLANAEFLSRAAGILTSTNFTFVCWTYLPADAGFNYAVPVDLNGAGGDAYVYVNKDYIYGEYFGGGAPQIFGNLLGWHQVAFGYDSVETKAFLSLDGGAKVYAGDTDVAKDLATYVLWLGKLSSGMGGENFQQGPSGVWSSALSDTVLDSLFNSGVGKSYADLTAAEKVGLVSYWNLDEQSGVRYDSHGSNDLTDNNTVGSVNSGPKGAVANFIAGNSEYLSLAGGISALDGDFTFSTWINPDFTGRWSVFQNGVGNTAGVGIEYNIYGNGDVLTALQTATYPYDNSITAAGALTAGWHHLVWSYEVGVGQTLYIDNVSVPFTSGGNETYAVDSGSPFRLCYRQDASRYGTHKLSGTAVHSRVLNAGERAALLAAGRGVKYDALPAGLLTGLVSYWNLDEASGVRYDSHGTNHLTDNNTVTSVINAGDAMDGAAASFVAANSESLSTVALSGFSDISISAWFKTPASPSNYQGVFQLGEGDYAIGTTLIAAYLDANNTLAIENFNNDGVQKLYKTYATLPSSTWHFVYAEYDAASGVVSCSLDNSALTAGTAQGAAGPNALDRLLLGTLGGSSYFGSQIDEVAIWSRVLTADERAELYALGRGRFYDFS